MISPKQLKKVVDKNRKWLKIDSRVALENMIYMTMELLKEAGYEDAAYFTKALYDEIENMDTNELVKEQIWVG